MVVRAQTKLQGFPTEIRFIIRCIHNSRIYYTSFCAKVIILWERRAIYKKRCIALVTNIKSLMCTYLHCTIVYNIDMTQNHQHLQNMMFCVEFICLLSFEWSMLLIIDGNSENAAHACRKKDLFRRRKYTIWDCSDLIECLNQIK